MTAGRSRPADDRSTTGATPIGAPVVAFWATGAVV